MGFILGFIIMFILLAVSSLPIFIVRCFKKTYGSLTAWCLFFICFAIYFILKILCIESGILAGKPLVPIIAMIVIYTLTKMGMPDK